MSARRLYYRLRAAVRLALGLTHSTPVQEFHEVFGAPVSFWPEVPTFERRRLRVALIAEELVELAQASGVVLVIDPDGRVRTCRHPTAAADLIEAADAMADLRYVVDGTSLEWGVPLDACLMEVHRSNMSKAGPDGRPILRPDGKILKGPGYTPPDLRCIILGRP